MSKTMLRWCNLNLLLVNSYCHSKIVLVIERDLATNLLRNYVNFSINGGEGDRLPPLRLWESLVNSPLGMKISSTAI